MIQLNIRMSESELNTLATLRRRYRLACSKLGRRQEIEEQTHQFLQAVMVRSALDDAIPQIWHKTVLRMKPGDKVVRIVEGWPHEGEVVKWDEEEGVIEATFFLGVPTPIKFDIKTGICVDGERFGYLEVPKNQGL